MSPAYRGALILKHNGSMTRREDGVAGRLARAGVTEREAEVLLAVAERLRNREIAGRLHVSVRTVESHVAALLRKLDVADRAALAEIGAELGRTASPDASLPVPLTSLIGRQSEMSQLTALIDDLDLAVRPRHLERLPVQRPLVMDLCRPQRPDHRRNAHMAVDGRPTG